MMALTMATPAPSQAGRVALLAAALLLATAALAQSAAAKRETALLSEKEYPMQLEEVVVRAQRPQWRKKEAPPDWNRGKFDLDTTAEPSRLQLAPKYSRDERDDYNGVRDRMNAEPRIKLFELKF